jgi:hypothetical protein
MRGCFKAALAFGLVAALSAPALAQGGRGGYGGGGQGGVAYLIANPAVQKELKLETEQVEKANALAAEVREKMGDIQSQLDGLDRQEAMAKRQELSKPINEEATKKVKAFLKEAQYTRLTQIELQQRGINALTDPTILKKLSVTDEQKSKVSSLMTDMQSEMQEIRQSAGDDRQAMMQKTTELRAETTKKVMALMTDDQKKTWKEMSGEPFTMPAMQGRPGGRPAR